MNVLAVSGSLWAAHASSRGRTWDVLSAAAVQGNDTATAPCDRAPMAFAAFISFACRAPSRHSLYHGGAARVAPPLQFWGARWASPHANK